MSETNGTHPPETRPLSKTLVRLVRRILAEHNLAAQREISEAVAEAELMMGFPEGECWDCNVDRGVWIKQDKPVSR